MSSFSYDDSVVSVSTMFFVVVIIVIAALLCYYAFVHDTFYPDSIMGKRVLVTGAASGIGEEMAYYYSRLGASLVITDCREELLKNVAAKCKTLGTLKVEYVAVDLAVPQNRIELVQETHKHLGGLDHLILNHGILTAYLWEGSLENITSLQHQMEVNFFSYVDIASKSLDMLRESKGSIGVVSSCGSRITPPFIHSYAASKAALMGFFGSFRQELIARKTGISVTVATLGFIRTDAAVDIMSRTFPSLRAHLISSASAENTAMVIVRGVSTRTPEVYYPFLIFLSSIVHCCAPTQFESYITSQLFASIHPLEGINEVSARVGPASNDANVCN